MPLLIVTPLTFLGGSFYSIDMLPPFWQAVTLFNPVVYLVSGFRWSFFGQADVHIGSQRRPCSLGAGDLPRHRHLDVPHGLPAEELSTTAPAHHRNSAGALMLCPAPPRSGRASMRVIGKAVWICP